jgi:dihydrofolate reductase
MKIILAMATSLNGLIARENGEEDWLPSEGWDEFLAEVKVFNNFVMGREAFEIVQRLYKDYNFDNITADDKIIITRNLDFVASKEYKIVHSPQESIKYLTDKGVEKMLLIGGGKLNSEFLKMGLINEIWLTINPIILGNGRPFVAPENFDIKLELLENKPLSNGRTLLKYAVKLSH